ncbi:alpha/beta fold hydrolase [Intestinimonas timonensis]|uniref:alpha/beta fold hydrolase n=1 Tax=Intestinimonas timonensis TaxID=1689270 RepID=UPI0024B080E0|nr:alpha/beta fold hydrolase [Intestinimonas timonensis]
MKKKVLSLVLAAAMVMGLAAPALAAEESENGKIVILHTNDVHCGIDPVTDEETGAVTNVGYAGVAAYKAEMEEQYGAENVTLVDAGDAIQGGPIGTLSKGSYIVDIMNEVGYDFAIPGNHEFDYGMDNFLTLAKEKAEYTYLCCNFTDLEGNAVLDAYKVVDYGDVSVGYVGIDTPESFTKSTPTYFQDAEGNYIYSFSQGNEGADLYAAVQKAVDAAVADGADYVVALGHLGNEGSTDVWTSKSVIANTTGIDVFIDGHSHETYDETVQNKDGEDVVLAQTGTKLANIGKVVIDTKTGDITAELVSGYEKQDETVAAYVAGVNEEFAGVLQEVVAKSDVALTTLDPATGERAVRNAETNLGDLCADAYRVLLGADIAFVNGGGIRADIAAGDITYEDIINVHPFGNEACLVETTGQDILDALEMGARLYPEENGGFLQVSGISYTIDASVPSSVVLSDEGEFVKVDGDYRVKDVMVGDEPLDVTKTYTLASHNYMLKSGGDGFVMFKDDTVLKDCVMIDNQVLINYIVDELGGVVSADYAEPQGRITVVNADQAAETPEEPEAPADWADVAAAAWYAEAVNYVIENGIMGSTSTDAKVFTPDGTVTRATVYQTLYNMEGKPAVTEAATFTDVAGTWYADSAAWAEDTGLTTGDGTGAYAGDRAVTRAELATIFARYAEVKGLATTAGDLSTYADAADVAEWAADGMSVAVGSGIMGGKPGNLLDPNGTAVRTELATILLNFSKLTPAEETETDAEATYISETVSIEANGRIVPAVVTLPVGEGPFPAVVLNHGHGGNKDEGTGFGGIAEALAEAGIASIRMDFPGCGDSTEPFTENTLSNMIADSNAAKDYLVANYPVDADKLGILGYSMGGRIALEIITAEDNPYKATLILSGLSTPGDEAIANILPEGMTVEDAIAVAEEKGSYDYTTQYGQNLSLSAQWFTDMLVDPLANIDNYTGPMLVIHGDKDDVVTDATNKLTVSSYPAAEELIVPDADHGYGFYSDQPDVTAMVEGSITDFFAEHLVGAAETEAAA